MHVASLRLSHSRTMSFPGEHNTLYEIHASTLGYDLSLEFESDLVLDSNSFSALEAELFIWCEMRPISSVGAGHSVVLKAHVMMRIYTLKVTVSSPKRLGDWAQ
ncbi:hypothetical protein N7449_001277 [Penicillium cf. viridicatum]|uniref:Uncharacterized protein n=1 Tax=Penicillium cf. viridicatum TaxID=2972119 RepID=A0A9W9N6G9_9EURO|nr:hypothetical protein N7449_001277 [Penicillium cf. viridicatum]